jgi:hypothetical protein
LHLYRKKARLTPGLLSLFLLLALGMSLFAMLAGVLRVLLSAA